jgi:hypothetical protein
MSENLFAKISNKLSTNSFFKVSSKLRSNIINPQKPTDPRDLSKNGNAMKNIHNYNTKMKKKFLR